MQGKLSHVLPELNPSSPGPARSMLPAIQEKLPSSHSVGDRNSQISNIYFLLHNFIIKSKVKSKTIPVTGRGGL
jgi:hypothetical protein